MPAMAAELEAGGVEDRQLLDALRERMARQEASQSSGGEAGAGAPAQNQPAGVVPSPAATREEGAEAERVDEEMAGDISPAAFEQACQQAGIEATPEQRQQLQDACAQQRQASRKATAGREKARPAPY